MAEEINRIVTFFAGESLCGIDILETQEIIKTTQMTPVPLARDTISGIINLRGSIVTVIDLNRRLGLSEESGFTDPVSHRIIIVRIQEESVGLVVNAIGDVMDIAPGDLAPPPGNIQGIQGRCFKSVLRHEQGLIGILDVATVLE
jgi:purine-binding chemotaxis protein CheW